MNREQAKEVAHALLAAEDVAMDREAMETDHRAIVRSLEALLPDLEEGWAVPSLKSMRQPDEKPEPMLFGLTSGTLWAVAITRPANERSHWPLVAVSRYGQLRWRIATVADAQHRDSEGVHRVLRSWDIELGRERFVFLTDHPLLHDPEPSHEELLGRALAAEVDWQIDDLSADSAF